MKKFCVLYCNFVKPGFEPKNHLGDCLAPLCGIKTDVSWMGGEITLDEIKNSQSSTDGYCKNCVKKAEKW